MSGQASISYFEIFVNNNSANVPSRYLVKVPHSKWIGLSPEQWKHHVEKVCKIHYGQRIPLILVTATAALSSIQHLSIRVEDAEIHHVQSERLQCIWQKAEELLSTPGFVLPATGNPESCRQVASLSNQGKKNVPPHFVTCERRKNGTEVKCDCSVYRSIPNICQHALSVAEDMKMLSEYPQWIRRTKKSPNLSLLISDSIPKTAGNKSSKKRKGPPKSGKPCIQPMVDTTGPASLTPLPTTPPSASSTNLPSFPPNTNSSQLGHLLQSQFPHPSQLQLPCSFQFQLHVLHSSWMESFPFMIKCTIHLLISIRLQHRTQTIVLRWSLIQWITFAFNSWKGHVHV